MSTDDEDLKKISRLLEVGATMLADHCTECGAPLFRYHGEVMCPLCNNPTNATNAAPQGTGQMQSQMQHDVPTEPKASTRPAPIRVKHVTQSPAPPRQSMQSTPSTPSTPAISPGEQSTLEDVIQIKISEIATSMSQEGDLHKIKGQLECIEQGVRVLKLLR